jgi:iron complex outermembrane receptor protein
MNKLMPNKKLALNILMITMLPSFSQAEEKPTEKPTTLPTIKVEGERLPEPGVSQERTKDISGLSIDTGDFLRRIPGVSGTRMGGHGIDPIIRGLRQNQLNILLDGAYVNGACPNRMDPPTSYSPIETYDTVKVIRGSQTVIYGGGGSGGTILFERKTPRLSDDKFFRSQISGGYTSNSATINVFGDLTAGNTQGFVRGIVEHKDTSNYEDGEGNETRAAFTQDTGNLIFGYTPSEKTRFELGFEASRTDEALYAGAGMDSPETDNEMIRFRFDTEWGTKGELYYADVDHTMDNYSLRLLSAPMKMRVSAKSKTQGGRVSHNWLMDNQMEWTLGMDYQHNNRKANRFAGPANVIVPMNLQSMMWPDADLTQYGLFGETLMPFGELNTLKLGLRYDRVNSEASLANKKAMGGITPNQLYKQYYGKSANEQDENNVGGFIRYERDLSDGNGFAFISLSRSVRSADATERFLAANNNNAALRWIGNPDLNPEQHHQIEFGLSVQDSNDWDIGASLFYNHVTDYILRDRAHAQQGILQNDKANIYRNIDAQLYGFEWEGKLKWNANFTSHITLDYVYAVNTTNDRVIAQTPPFTGSFSLDYKRARLHLGGKLLHAQRQRRIDNDPNAGSGLDIRETPSFTVLDIYSRFDINKQAAIKLGIHNLFDKNYAYHVNRANVDPFNPAPVQVNEPGQTFWLNIMTRF